MAVGMFPQDHGAQKRHVLGLHLCMHLRTLAHVEEDGVRGAAARVLAPDFVSGSEALRSQSLDCREVAFTRISESQGSHMEKSVERATSEKYRTRAFNTSARDRVRRLRPR
jgi:hypothetical protein